MANGDVLDTTDANALIDAVISLIDGPAALDALDYAGKVAAVDGEDIIREELYPPTDGKKPELPLYYTRQHPDGSTYQSKFKNMRQQRKVLALGSKKKIPYPRTGRTGATLTGTSEVSPDGVTLIWGTNRPGAKYFLGRDTMNHYLASLGWKPLQDKVDAKRAQIIEGFAQALRSFVRGYLAKKGR